MHLSNVRTSVSRPDKIYLESRYNKPVIYLPIGVDELQPDLEQARKLLSQYGLIPGQFIIFTAGRHLTAQRLPPVPVSAARDGRKH
jgi:hypothetical protein